MRILIVEDEQALANALRDTLDGHGFEVDVTHTVFTGIDAALTNAYDCLVMDVMLPDGNGVESVAQLRQLGCSTPVLLLTALNEPPDRVRGLNAGADDYLGKPFDPDELIARLHAVIRRASSQRELDVLEYGSTQLYRNSRTLQVNGKTLELSSKEFMLLEYLYRNPRQVLSREQLICHLWGPEAEVADNALDTYVYYLRKKCDKMGVPQIIRTIRGQGYMLGPSA